MSLAKKAIDQLIQGDIEGLVGAPAEPQSLVALKEWSRSDAAIAAASLANTSGGLIVVGAATSSNGEVTAIGGSQASESDLLAIGGDLGPGSDRLLGARTIDVGGKQVGVIAVAESATPPVLVETSGGIFVRTDMGLLQVTSRAGLDRLTHKDQLLRERAETNVHGLIGRTTFGHYNYMSLAVLSAPRVSTGAPYARISGSADSLGDLDFVRRWGLTSEHVAISPGEVEIRLPFPTETTGFIRVLKNGGVSVGERGIRPASEKYLAPSEVSSRLSEMAETTSAIYQTTTPGLVLSSAFGEGLRDLRLPVEGGLTKPVKKDLLQVWLPERFLGDPDEGAGLKRDLLEAVGPAFGADLVRGEGKAQEVPASKTGEAKIWRGQTKRTERRLEGARAHGST